MIRNSWAQRRAARERADDTMVRTWLHANPCAPLGALWVAVPLSGRRIRRAVARLADAANLGITDAEIEARLDAAHAEIARRNAAKEAGR
ncbi:hypothetical protein [Streptacidiphilus sp. EB129]|uniref:hypothetical protein n=1 Tax=Streptacidiphilus sp. EB129 TaxID=3156262 RepID=UPI003514AA6C